MRRGGSGQTNVGDDAVLWFHWAYRCAFDIFQTNDSQHTSCSIRRTLRALRAPKPKRLGVARSGQMRHGRRVFHPLKAPI